LTGHQCGRLTSNAGRQAGYRARHKAAQPSVIVRSLRRLAAGPASKPWHGAVAERVEPPAGCAAWLDAMPASLRGTATVEAPQAIIDLDLDGLAAVKPPGQTGFLLCTECDF
jgi:hypothetical protein